MGYDTFKTYKEKVSDENLKNEFAKILDTFESNKKTIISYIESLDGKVKDNLGLDAEMVNIFQKIKDVFMNNDKDIVHHALKNMERGTSSSERVVKSLQKEISDEAMIQSLNNIIDEYKCISNHFEEIYKNM